MQRFLEHILYASPVGITVADAAEPDFPLMFVNPAFEAMTGYIGRSVGQKLPFFARHRPRAEGTPRHTP
jgi:PAS domain-containing protein